MTQKKRIEAVYRGEIPDQVPFMLDLSHWYYHKNRISWDLSRSYNRPGDELIAYHKKMDVGFYMPNLGTFFEVSYPENIKAEVLKSEDGQTITWSFETPVGKITRNRIWEKESYSWGIRDWSIKTEEQLNILACALENRSYRFLTEKYQAWIDCIGDCGVCYVGPGYSGMGQLLSYWMGVEGVTFATFDWPDVVRETIDRINENNLKLIDALASSPVKFICMGDNFSSDIQPPYFFDQWSRKYYTEAIAKLHAAGKKVAVHIDGKLSGAIRMIRETGADCIDAVTPFPMGDLTPRQCRAEAGEDIILSGGLPPNLWLPDTDIAVFKKAVMEWLELKKCSSRLIANAGDQVPPNAEEERIEVMRDLVERYGKY